MNIANPCWMGNRLDASTPRGCRFGGGFYERVGCRFVFLRESEVLEI